MISIQNNILAWNAGRQLGIKTKKNAKNTEKLSSGYRINRAADDAAGLAISEKMRRQIRGLNQAAENVQDGIGYVQTGDGALVEVHDMLQRMNELAVKSANGTNSEEDREYIDNELQQLKKEMDRIFQTTTFNERNIWEINNKKLIGTEMKQAVTIPYKYQSIKITNANCGIVACGGYKINADTTGVNISWIGYDGQDYQTETVDWDTLEANQYSFEMSDYFGEKTADNKLYDASGKPVFTNKVSFSPVEAAEIDDMITCLNGRTMGGSPYAYLRANFEDASAQNTSHSGVSVSANINYSAAYASNHNTGTAANAGGTTNCRDFDNADDAFLIPMDQNGKKEGEAGYTGNLISAPPNNISVADAKTSGDGWTYSFYMDGIGTVKAKATSVQYSGNDSADEYENIWWNWSDGYDRYGNYIRHYYKSAVLRTVTEQGPGTLGDVMACLTGDRNSSSPGLLTKSNGGDGTAGGTVRINFDLDSEAPYSFGDNKTSSDVGSFTIFISVNSSDTETTVLNKIKDAMKLNTASSNLDLSSYPNGYDGAYIYSASPATHEIETPVYGGDCLLSILAGPEKDCMIDLVYDHMSVIELGLADTDVKTQQDSLNAIDEIKSALTMVNKQRAEFGAYQNRLEHAYNNNKNVEENTQAAESAIRDTDMATVMVDYANHNILLQVGQSMLAQANRQPESVLGLLQ